MRDDEKTYKELCDEREYIIEQREIYKRGHGRISIGPDSYYDQLFQILKIVEREMIPYEIRYRFHLYQKLNEKLPVEIILIIASYGDVVDDVASKKICLV